MNYNPIFKVGGLIIEDITANQVRKICDELLDGFLSMAIPNLKLLVKSVINFDI